MIERQRQRHHRADHQHQRDDRAGGEGQRQQVQPEESTLLALAIDHVQGLDHGLDAGIGAPDREGEAEQEGRAERGVALGEHARDLVLHDLERALRQHHRQGLEVGADGGGICEQSVGRHQRRDGRETPRAGQRTRRRLRWRADGHRRSADRCATGCPSSRPRESGRGCWKACRARPARFRARRSGGRTMAGSRTGSGAVMVSR